MSDHEQWEALAAGYALDALEPGDEQAFAEHLRGCSQCARDLAALRDVTAQLAYAAPAAEPPADLGARIRAAAEAERPATPTAPVVPLAPRRERSLPPLVFAAAAVLVVFALGVWNVTLQGDNRAQHDATARRSAALACFAAPGGTTFRLSAPSGQRATVCVTGSAAYVVADNLTPNDPRSVYVLWWLDAADTPHAVERFDVPKTSPAVFALPLAVRPADVHAMAVSLEPGRVLPEKPTNPVAQGTAT